MHTVHGRAVGMQPQFRVSAHQSAAPQISERNVAPDLSEADLFFNGSGMQLPTIPGSPNLTGPDGQPTPADVFQRGNRVQQMVESAEMGDVTALKALFEQKRVDPELADDLGRNALHHAAMEGRSEAVRYLLHGQRLSPNQTSGSGKTPLHYVADGTTRGHVEAAEWLLRTGARVNQPDDFSQTPLMYAAGGGSADMVILLINAGAKPDKPNRYGKTPLMDAAATGHCKVASILLSTGRVQINHANCYGTTALMMAAREGQVDMVRYLLRKDANPLLKDRQGHSALFLAAAKLAQVTDDNDARQRYQTIVDALSTAMREFAARGAVGNGGAQGGLPSTLVITKEPVPVIARSNN